MCSKVIMDPRRPLWQTPERPTMPNRGRCEFVYLCTGPYVLTVAAIVNSALSFVSRARRIGAVGSRCQRSMWRRTDHPLLGTTETLAAGAVSAPEPTSRFPVWVKAAIWARREASWDSRYSFRPRATARARAPAGDRPMPWPSRSASRASALRRAGAPSTARPDGPAWHGCAATRPRAPRPGPGTIGAGPAARTPG